MLLIIVELIFVVGFLYYAIKALLEWILDFRRRRNGVKDIPCENRHWLYGNSMYYSANITGMKRELQSMMSYPECFQNWFGPMSMSVVGYYPDFCKTLLSRNEPKSGFSFKFLSPWIGEGLLLSSGKKWKRNRRLLTPVFHFDSLKRYLPCVNNAAMEMMKKWNSVSEKSTSVELFHDIGLTTLDNLLRCLFSKNSGCESGENRRYLTAVKYITRETAKRFRNPLFYFNFVYYLTEPGKRYLKESKVAHDFTEKTIQERLKQMQDVNYKKDSSDYDFLDVLLMAKDDGGKGLTHKEIRDELDTFVFEGHDTVTSGISWAFYNLALYPDLQELCRDEVMKVLDGENRIQWKHLPKLEYLTKFIKESMRINPPVVQIGRRLSQPIFFPRSFGFNQGHYGKNLDSSGKLSHLLPTNLTVIMRIFLLHRNPTVWENPDIFDPERFHPDNVAKRPPHSYIPFSTGPRNCIGQNFAMNEMKVVLAMALSMFKFTVDENYPKPEMQPSVVLRSSTGIHLIVEKL